MGDDGLEPAFFARERLGGDGPAGRPRGRRAAARREEGERADPRTGGEPHRTTSAPRYMPIPHVNATVPLAGIVMSTGTGSSSGRSR